MKSIFDLTQLDSQIKGASLADLLTFTEQVDAEILEAIKIKMEPSFIRYLYAMRNKAKLQASTIFKGASK